MEITVNSQQGVMERLSTYLFNQVSSCCLKWFYKLIVVSLFRSFYYFIYLFICSPFLSIFLICSFYFHFVSLYCPSSVPSSLYLFIRYIFFSFIILFYSLFFPFFRRLFTISLFLCLHFFFIFSLVCFIRLSCFFYFLSSFLSLFIHYL